MNFSLKPVFIGWIALLCQLPLQLFFTLWCGGFFGALTKSTGIFPKDSSMPFIFFGALAFFGFPAVTYIGKKLNYSRTEYKFYDDRLEFEEGFFSINKKVIKYKDVKEVTLRKGIFQRAYALGTIYLATLATGSSSYTNVFSALGFGNVSASGVGVRDIRDPDQTYEKIKNMVDTHNT
jgi:membrane protein YdbS with pleckstrin-like domain